MPEGALCKLFTTALNIIWMLVAVYAAIGLAAAAYMHLRGLERLDSGVSGAGWLFRLLITPGIIGLWPVLLRRLRHDESPDPTRPFSPSQIRSAQGAFAALLAVLLPILVGIALIYRESTGP